MLENPYWEDINLLNEYGIIPVQHFYLRDHFTLKYAFTVPDPTMIDFLARHLSPLAIEVGAGTGYYAWLLKQMGIDILAYDIAPPSQTYTPVQVGGPDVLLHEGERTLFLCWPPYRSDMALQCLQHYSGNRLVYIGEYECCATSAFFDQLENDWQEIESYQLVQWYGLHDIVTIYSRKK